MPSRPLLAAPIKAVHEFCIETNIIVYVTDDNHGCKIDYYFVTMVHMSPKLNETPDHIILSSFTCMHQCNVAILISFVKIKF